MNNALTKTLTAGLNNGLKVKDTYENKVLYIDYTSQTYDFKHVGLKLCIERNERFKPFLFPMSALTKEIDFKGERFVPVVELAKLLFDEIKWQDGGFELVEDNKVYFHSYESVNHFWFGYDRLFMVDLNGEECMCGDLSEYILIFDFLHEHHFNVFGLSPDEYIEVNEDNNPYR